MPINQRTLRAFAAALEASASASHIPRPSGDAVAVAGENVSAMHPKRARREVAATPEVVKDLVETVIAAGKRVLARDDPANLGREQLA